MICTFGDLTDVIWWRELSLPVRAILQANGALKPITFGAAGWESADVARAQQAYDQLVNLSAVKARAKLVELLKESGDLIGEPRPITHPVKFYEKGDRPLEIITSRQWFIKTMIHREQLIERGRQMSWHPEYMRARYEDWVNGLSGDWCISRQRFFGVPFPVWYPIKSDGTIDYASPLAADGSAAADRSVDGRAGRLHGRSAQSAWRVRGRSRHHGHVGHVIALAAGRGEVGRGQRSVLARVPDGFASAGARHHPHVAVLDGAARASRARLAAVDARGDLGLGARSRSQEDVEVQGQRRHAARAAGAARVGRRALLGGARTSGHRHRVRPRADEGRAAARDQAAERLEVRAGDRRAARTGDGAARSRHPDEPEPPRRRGDGASRRLRLRARAGADRGVLLGLLRRSSRTGEVAALRRAGTGSARLGEHRAADDAVDPAAAVRAVSAVRDRRSVVVVEGRIGAPRVVADAGGSARAAGRPRRSGGGAGASLRDAKCSSTCGAAARRWSTRRRRAPRSSR